MARDNISYRQLADKIGCDQANLHRLAKHGKTPGIETYLRVRRWLDEGQIVTAHEMAETLKMCAPYIQDAANDCLEAPNPADHIYDKITSLLTKAGRHL